MRGPHILTHSCRDLRSGRGELLPVVHDHTGGKRSNLIRPIQVAIRRFRLRYTFIPTIAEWYTAYEL